MGIIAAMEQAQEENLGAESLEQAADQAAVVGEDRADISEVAGEISTDTAEVEQASADIEELTEIGEVAEASIESGEGLSEQAAEVATIAIERIHNRLGFAGKQRIISAVESFGHTNTRLASTKLVVESITDTIKTVWEAIKSMAKRVWDKIVQFFKKIFGGAKALISHLENLKKRVESLSADGEMKEEELSGGVAKKIAVLKEANAASYGKLVANALALGNANSKLGDGTITLATTVHAFTADLAGAKVTEASLKKFETEVTSISNSTGGLLNAIQTLSVDNVVVEGGNKDKTESKVFGPFVNASGIEYALIKKGNVTFAKINRVAVKKDQIAEKAKALSKTEILTVITGALSVAKAAEAQEKHAANLEKVIKTVQSSCDSVLRSVSKMAGAEEKEEISKGLSEARDAINNSFANTNAVCAMIPKILLDTGYAGADYASASIANFGSKKK